MTPFPTKLNLVVGILNLLVALWLLSLGEFVVAAGCGVCGAYNIAIFKEWKP